MTLRSNNLAGMEDEAVAIGSAVGGRYGGCTAGTLMEMSETRVA